MAHLGALGQLIGPGELARREDERFAADEPAIARRLFPGLLPHGIGPRSTLGRRIELGQGHLHGLFPLHLQRHDLPRHVVIDHLGRPGRRLHRGVQLGSAALEVLVGIELVAQTAHEAPAQPRDLLGVQREPLLLGHADGHGAELAAESLAAQLLTAVPDAAHHAGLVAHADLTHVDAHVEAGRQLAHQLAEVDALLGLEVEDGLVAVEQKLHGHRVHVLVVLPGHLLEHREGLGGGTLHLGCLLDVLFGGDALHGAQGALQSAHLLLGHLDDLARGDAELGAPGGAHHHGHVFLYIQIARIEPQRPGVEGQVNRCDPNHEQPLLRRTATCPSTFLGIHYRPAPARTRPPSSKLRRWPPHRRRRTARRACRAHRC